MELRAQTERLELANAALSMEQRKVGGLERQLESQRREMEATGKKHAQLDTENATLRAERDRLQKSIQVIGDQLSHAREAKDQALAALRDAGGDVPVGEMQTH